MSTTSSSSLLRTKSLRVPTSSNLRPVSTTQAQTAQQTGPSHISLFLTNLRLLNLDLRSDWPGISAVTFTTKDSQQNQKKRIQCVEWALYHLFALWDPEETRNKLHPFFPPLDPLQSLNLRAALFRCLDQAKKSGLLGRDAVLRKTMLDECKGERLEEVLAVFSIAVLKRVIQENNAGHEAIAQRLAMENFSYTGERTALLALIFAHKHSLHQALAMKKEAQKNYKDFADLLKLKERQITRRQEQLKVAIEENDGIEDISKRDIKDLQDKVQKNWYGSNEWLDTILHGDSRAASDALLTDTYGNVWKHVENGRIGEIEDSHRKGLLEQLDARVRDQNRRLEKWQDFRDTLKNRKTGASKDVPISPEKSAKGIDLGFSAHEALQLPRTFAKSTKVWQPLPEHARLIENMEMELANVGKPQKPVSPAKKRVPVHKVSERIRSPTPEPVQETDPEEDEWVSNSDSDEPAEPSPVFHKSLSQTPPSEQLEEKERSLSPELAPITEELTLPIRLAPPSSPPVSRSTSNHSIMPPPSPPTPEATPDLAEPDMADQILNSMATTSPSPVKPRHILSLAERTRMSMSRLSISKGLSPLEDFDDLPDLPQMPPPPSRTSSTRRSLAPPTSLEASVAAEATARHEALIERTRLSLSNMASVAKSAQLERRRSTKLAAKQKRMSYMPNHVPLEPTIEGPDGEVVDRMALIEGAEEVDYEAVFKSRPKIKTSPATSPVKAWGEMGGMGVRGGSSSPVGEL